MRRHLLSVEVASIVYIAPNHSFNLLSATSENLLYGAACGVNMRESVADVFFVFL